MKRLNVVLVAALILTPKAWAQEADDFLIRPIVKNPVQADLSISKGEKVYVRPQHLKADTAFVSYEEIAQRNQLSIYEQSENALLLELSKRNPPRPSLVNMTPQDYASLVSKYGSATKASEMTGQRPILDGQVKLSINGVGAGMYESIYRIEDLALTKNVTSEHFRIKEQVLFPTLVNGNIVYKQGHVAAIALDGDLIVEKGLETARVNAEHLFSMERDYSGQKYNRGEELLYKYRGSEERVKVVGSSPSGDIIIFFPKLSSYVKIPAHEMTAEMTREGLNPVKKAPLSCNKLFAL